MSKKHFFHIITYGCQMNKNDSERLESILLNFGLIKANSIRQADLVLINSCSVRESAEHRVWGQIRNLVNQKKKNPELLVGLTGCMPGRDKNGSIKKKMQGIDLFFSTNEMTRLPEMIFELRPAWIGRKRLTADYFNIKPTRQNQFQAFVTIQTGCNHFCTYCVVPYARGTEGNRSVKSILHEIKELADNGFVEITLLGQIINHYQAPDSENFSKLNPFKKNDFARLLWEVNQIKGIERINWTASHPIYMDDEMIGAFKLPKQVNYLHLPVQSGNDEVLRKMNRRHNRAFFISLIESIRKAKPDIAIGTDIIVGFCGETEEQFQDTVDLYKKCDFDIAYLAKYSTRSGTAASVTWKDDVSQSEKIRRWKVLQDLMEKIVKQKNQKYVGKTVSVLVGKSDFGLCNGYSLEMKLVQFKGDCLVGRIVDVKIEKAEEWILYGSVV